MWGRKRRRSVVKVEAVQLGLVVVFGDRDPGLTCTHGEQESEYKGKGGWQASKAKGGNGGARRTLLGTPRFAETAQRAALIQLRHNFQPLFCARRPAQKVSCAARRHLVSPAQREKFLSGAQEAKFACEKYALAAHLEGRS